MVPNPELLLNKEKERIGERDYETIDDLLMSIGDTLWDMVTIRAGIYCPNCIYDELRYVIAEKEGTQELLLQCETVDGQSIKMANNGKRDWRSGGFYHFSYNRGRSLREAVSGDGGKGRCLRGMSCKVQQV